MSANRADRLLQLRTEIGEELGIPPDSLLCRSAAPIALASEALQARLLDESISIADLIEANRQLAANAGRLEELKALAPKPLACAIEYVCGQNTCIHCGATQPDAEQYDLRRLNDEQLATLDHLLLVAAGREPGELPASWRASERERAGIELGAVGDEIAAQDHATETQLLATRNLIAQILAHHVTPARLYAGILRPVTAADLHPPALPAEPVALTSDVPEPAAPSSRARNVVPMKRSIHDGPGAPLRGSAEPWRDDGRFGAGRFDNTQ